MTEAETRRFIRNKLKAPAAKAALCAKWGVRRQYLSALISERSDRPLPAWLLSEFGLTKKRITVYEVRQ